MRSALCRSLVECASDPDFVFLTGDLGYMALEPLRDAAGSRFINAGVAEQNMISVAAGLAHEGMQVWTYSIAPFLYARPYEQIRNDVCLHDLPVRLVGNGGGYGYGVMGPTHHAIEDYGALLCLGNISVFVPAFDEDVHSVVSRMAAYRSPSYLRLGIDESPAEFVPPVYAPWRRVLQGDGPPMVVVGPLVGGLLAPLRSLPRENRPSVWVVSEMPFTEETLPDPFLDELDRSGCLVVVEEHVAHGSAGQSLTHLLCQIDRSPSRLIHRHALGYVSGKYGSQAFHRTESGLDPRSILCLFA